MKRYEERTETVKRTAYVETQCDLCGAVSRTDWKKEDSDATEVKISLREGHLYHGYGGAGEETTVDICPNCFKQKLIPWVISQGGSPQTKAWSW